jgi:eukaryotic-like serine/threonine-protein kinase
MNPDSSSEAGRPDQALQSEVNRLLERYISRLAEQPSLSPEAFLAEFPCVPESVQPLLSTVQLLSRTGSKTGSPKAGDGLRPEDTLSAAAIQLADFEIHHVLGRGGMGIVFLATQKSLGRLVALKALPIGLSPDPVARQRFQLEARVAASLQHPNIVPVYTIGSEHGIDYFAMQYIQGQSLSKGLQELRSGKEDPEREAARICLEVAQALSAAHRSGIIHRDVKPSNILLDTAGKAYLTDFGLAHVEQDVQLTSPGMILGSLRYMAPEQLNPRQLPVDARCDVYSLGATLYEMVTGQPVTQGHNRRALLSNLAEHAPVPPRNWAPALERDLETIILKAVQAERNERYSSAVELADDLQAYLEHRPIAAKRRSWRSTLQAWGKRNPALATLTGLFLGLLVCVSVGASIAALHMHRLANDRAESLILVERERNHAQSLSKLLIEAFRSSDPAVDGRNYTVASMLQNASMRVRDDESIDNAARGDLLDAIGQSLRELGDFDAAAQVHQAGLQLRDKALGHTALPTIMSMARVALAERDLSRLTDSIDLYVRALELINHHHPHAIAERIEVLAALAMAYQDNLQLRKAELLHREALQLSREHLGESDKRTLQSMNNLALWFQESNRFQEALELHSETLRLREQLLSKKHPDTLQSMANLVGAMQDVGKLAEAADLQNETLQLHREILGDRHPNTLINLNNAALLYADLGRTDETVQLLEEVLRAMRDKLGHRHQDTLISMGNLAHFYLQSGKTDAAMALATERLAAEIELRGEKNSIVANCHAQLAAIYLSTFRQNQEMTPNDEQAADPHLQQAAIHMASALEIRRGEAAIPWIIARDESKLGEILALQGLHAEASKLLLSSLQILQEQQDVMPPSIGDQLVKDAQQRLLLLPAEPGR